MINSTYLLTKDHMVLSLKTKVWKLSRCILAIQGPTEYWTGAGRVGAADCMTHRSMRFHLSGIAFAKKVPSGLCDRFDSPCKNKTNAIASTRHAKNMRSFRFAKLTKTANSNKAKIKK